MEEYTQITLDQWVEWKEDIRRKLQETASNFVYIGYRLKQIRDSGMYDGCESIFEFAKKEYGLERSTVSRFIAINEKFSKGGNSIELRDEFVGLNQSQLTEMLTLPDSECELITENTTIKDIRALKSFDKDMNAPEAADEAPETTEPETVEAAEVNDTPEEVGASEGVETPAEKKHTPLQECVIDFFKDKLDLLEEISEMLDERDIAEAMAPSGCTTHKKGIVFLFMYDYDHGVKYKQMGMPEPKSLSWEDFYTEIHNIFFDHADNYKEHLKEIYPENPESVQKAPEIVKNEPEIVENDEKTEQIEEKAEQNEAGSLCDVAQKSETEETDPEEPEQDKEEDREEETQESKEPVENAAPAAGDYEEIQNTYDDLLHRTDRIRYHLENRAWWTASKRIEELQEVLSKMRQWDRETIDAALRARFDD